MPKGRGGSQPDDTCSTCKGTGQIRITVTHPKPEPSEYVTCPGCHGTGKK